MEPLKQFVGASKSFRAYWNIYGGWGALLGSPYLWVSIALTALLAPMWLRCNWWDTVLSVMPNVLGFSIGGFAIFLAFGDDGFRNLIAGSHPGEDQSKASPYLEFSATFFHFVVVQVLAILTSLSSKSFYLIELSRDSTFTSLNNVLRPIWWCIGFTFFCYAICSALSAAMAIFTLTRSFDDYISNSKDDEHEP